MRWLSADERYQWHQSFTDTTDVPEYRYAHNAYDNQTKKKIVAVLRVELAIGCGESIGQKMRQNVVAVQRSERDQVKHHQQQIAKDIPIAVACR